MDVIEVLAIAGIIICSAILFIDYKNKKSNRDVERDNISQKRTLSDYCEEVSNPNKVVMATNKRSVKDKMLAYFNLLK